MSTLTESNLHTRWRNIWQSFLQLVEGAGTPEEAQNVRRIKTRV